MEVFCCGRNKSRKKKSAAGFVRELLHPGLCSHADLIQLDRCSGRIDHIEHRVCVLQLSRDPGLRDSVSGITTRSLPIQHRGRQLVYLDVLPSRRLSIADHFAVIIFAIGYRNDYPEASRRGVLTEIPCRGQCGVVEGGGLSGWHYAL